MSAIALAAASDRATVRSAAAGVVAAAIAGAGIGGMAIASPADGPVLVSDAFALLLVAADTLRIAASFVTPAMILATVAAVAIYARLSDEEVERVSAS